MFVPRIRNAYNYKTNERKSHGDEGERKFTGSIARVVFANKVVLGTFFETLAFMQIETAET